MEKEVMPPLPRELERKAIALGAFWGIALVAVPYFGFRTLLGAEIHGAWSDAYRISLIVLQPLVQGILAGLVVGTYQTGGRYFSITFSMIAINYLLAAVFLKEGIICLIMALPLYAGIIAIGLMLGRAFSRFRNRKALHSTLIPIILLAVAYDANGPAPEFSNAVSDAVIVNASPEYVWRYIVQYPENTSSPEYWLWKIGLPEPIQSTASAASVGAARQCRFTKGITFEEQITELVPNKVLTFKITAQPDHPEIIGHFSLDKGQLYLEANPDGTTTIIATSWYRLFVRPASYFNWWAEDIVRNVHFRVLNHMKALAEKDKPANIAMVAQ